MPERLEESGIICVAGLAVGTSDRCVFLAFWGILPDTYLAAPPRPGFAAGSLLAITVVERGIIEVSSS